MALTTAQKISVFEIIDTPYTGSVDEMYGKYGLNATKWRSADNDNKVQVRILDRLANLTSEEEAVLIRYIDRWQYIGTQVWTMDAGSMGTTSGMNVSPDSELMRIRDRVKNLIPVRHYWETVQKSANESGAGGISINAIR